MELPDAVKISKVQMPFQKWLFLKDGLSKQAIPAGKIMDYVADYLIVCLVRTPQGHFITVA